MPVIHENPPPPRGGGNNPGAPIPEPKRRSVKKSVNRFTQSPYDAIALIGHINAAKPQQENAEVALYKSYKEALANANCRAVDGTAVNISKLIEQNSGLLQDGEFLAHLDELVQEAIHSKVNEAVDGGRYIKIAFCGKSNTGKSTFLNFLLGWRDRGVGLPEDCDVTTSVPANIRCTIDNANNVYAVNKRGGISIVDMEAVQAVRHAHHTRKDDDDIAKERKHLPEQIAGVIDHFVIQIQSQDFSGIELVDTPGIGSLGKDDQTTQDAVRQCDLIIYVIAADAGAPKDDDLEFLKNIKNEYHIPYVLVFSRMNCARGRDLRSIIDETIRTLSNNNLKPLTYFAYGKDPNANERRNARLQSLYQSKDNETLTDWLKAYKRSLMQNVDKRISAIEAHFDAEIDALTAKKSAAEDCKVVSNKTLMELDRTRRRSPPPANYTAEFKLLQSTVVAAANKYERLKKAYDALIDALTQKKTDIVEFFRTANIQVPTYKRLRLRKRATNLYTAIDNISDYMISDVITALYYKHDLTLEDGINNYSPLTYAAHKGNIPALLFMLELVKDEQDPYRALIRDSGDRNILDAAAQGGNGALVGMLCKKLRVNYDINTKQITRQITRN